MHVVDDNTTLRQLLESRAVSEPGHTFLVWKGRKFSIAEVNEATNRVANGLVQLGVGPGDHVATMVANSPDHVFIMLALAKIAAVWVPINVHAIGASLEFTLKHSHPRAIIADVEHRRTLEPLINNVAIQIWRDDKPGAAKVGIDFETLRAHLSAANPSHNPRPHDLLCISYTSGTTGQPKGVLVTDKMFRACGIGCAYAASMRPDDVVLVWEPIYHVGGSQMVALALVRKVTIVLLERFSASDFWNQCRSNGVTCIHYLGGILQILLKQPKKDDDSRNPVRSAWGGGCTTEIWKEFEDRFGVMINEDYGMTETSSYATYNPDQRFGSVGKALPYFDVQIGGDDGKPLTAGQVGEIMVREKERGLLLSGYYNNPEATRGALRNGWLHTGDLGRQDEDGYFYFLGRKKDSVRRRGENISAWEVESVLNDHPDVEECALIGVSSDIGDDDLKIVIKPVVNRKPDPAAIAAWCADRMPYFQVPRYFAFVDDFEKTPTERIKKEKLSRSTTDCWDRENARAPQKERSMQ